MKAFIFRIIDSKSIYIHIELRHTIPIVYGLILGKADESAGMDYFRKVILGSIAKLRLSFATCGKLAMNSNSCPT